jgi:tetratricopeptide (TPR) repeat protein
MNLVSKFAFAISLSSIAIVPNAYAKKDEKPAKAAPAEQKLKLSKPFLAAYAPAVDLFIKKKDLAAAKAAIPGLLSAATTPEDKHQLGIFAVNVGSQSQDVPLQKQGIELLMASPLSTPDKMGLYHYQRGAWSYDAKDYVAAEKDMTKAYELGYRKAQIESLISSAFGQQKRYPEAITWLKKSIDATIASGQKPDSKMYALGANYAIKAKDNAMSAMWLKDLVRADSKPGNWHDAMTILMRAEDFQSPELLDIFRLMRRTDGILYEQEYAGYVESVDPRRFPAEAIAVINEGVAKGIISKTNRTFADSLQTANSLLAEDLKTLSSMEATAKASPNGYQAALAGDVFLSHRDFTKAKAMYDLATSKGSLKDKDGTDQTDRVLMRKAIAHVNLGDFTTAKAELAKIKGAKRKAIADYWMIYIDQQAAKPVA